MMVTISKTPSLSATTPVLAYDLRKLRVRGDIGKQWDVLPDGRPIAIQKGDHEDEVTSMTVVLNWLELLRQPGKSPASR